MAFRVPVTTTSWSSRRRAIPDVSGSAHADVPLGCRSGSRRRAVPDVSGRLSAAGEERFRGAGRVSAGASWERIGREEMEKAASSAKKSRLDVCMMFVLVSCLLRFRVVRAGFRAQSLPVFRKAKVGKGWKAAGDGFRGKLPGFREGARHAAFPREVRLCKRLMDLFRGMGGLRGNSAVSAEEEGCLRRRVVQGEE